MPLFGPATLEPIRLHVDAKRFLCAREPGYLEALSPDSKRSLALQGGVFDEAQAKAFEALPFASDAVAPAALGRHRRSPPMPTVPALAHFVRHLEICAADHRRVRP